uniref:Uncharacterized protein n=1 Tax=Guillardia theta TaxID=55529 RepID=A0A7S4N5S9_GUITH
MTETFLESKKLTLIGGVIAFGGGEFLAIKCNGMFLVVFIDLMKRGSNGQVASVCVQDGQPIRTEVSQDWSLRKSCLERGKSSLSRPSPHEATLTGFQQI